MRADQILPDDVNHGRFQGLTIRKGTVAAFLANARACTVPLNSAAALSRSSWQALAQNWSELVAWSVAALAPMTRPPTITHTTSAAMASVTAERFGYAWRRLCHQRIGQT